jgi:hypothetical protein
VANGINWEYVVFSGLAGVEEIRAFGLGKSDRTLGMKKQ